ncbi:hypothetical protein F5B19DRAFT_480121 [Rostrohypoxylon terebratum]|nr:hypothetical protein F5B19DRAFT_480121 [Rostrohypoxylon terebratum]
MAPPPSTSYKSMSVGWKWYSAHETRPVDVPPFQIRGLNKVVIPNGELFCRFNMNHNTEHGVTLCPRVDKQQHWANLKRHVESHRVRAGDVLIPVELEKNRTGGLTMTDHYEISRYWDQVKQKIDEYNPSEELKSIDITLTRLGTRHPHDPEPKDLLIVPMTQSRTGRDKIKIPPRAKIQTMRLMCRIKKKVCNACKERGRETCPTNRKPYCEMWMRFQKHPQEVEDEDGDEGEESDSRSTSPAARKTVLLSTHDTFHQSTPRKENPGYPIVTIHDGLESFEKDGEAAAAVGVGRRAQSATRKALEDTSAGTQFQPTDANQPPGAIGEEQEQLEQLELDKQLEGDGGW